MSMSPSCQGGGPPNYSAFPYPLESEGWPTQGPPAMSQRVGPSSCVAEELSSTGATHPGQGISLTREGQGLGCDIVTLVKIWGCWRMPDRSKFSLSIQSIDAIGTAFLSIPRWKIESVIATVATRIWCCPDKNCLGSAAGGKPSAPSPKSRVVGHVCKLVLISFWVAAPVRMDWYSCGIQLITLLGCRHTFLGFNVLISYFRSRLYLDTYMPKSLNISNYPYCPQTKPRWSFVMHSPVFVKIFQVSLTGWNFIFDLTADAKASPPSEPRRERLGAHFL